VRGLTAATNEESQVTDMTMDALVVEKYGKAALRKMPRPEAPEDGVLIKVHYSGVSIGTEMLQGTGKHSNLALPFVAGYQATGEIVALGAKAEGYSVGEHVAIFCRGSHASYAAASVGKVHRIANPAKAHLTCLFVQPCVGANALDQAKVMGNDSVLVLGQGLIGQATAQLARLRGCFVAATDLSVVRLDIASRYCADWVLDAGKGALAEQTKSRFPNGFSVVLETTGVASVLDDALNCCMQAGRLSVMGYHPGRIELQFNVAHVRELAVHFPWFIGKHDLRLGVIRLIESGLFRMEPLISHQVSWSESLPLYQTLFTPARNDFNAIVFDWRKAA